MAENQEIEESWRSSRTYQGVRMMQAQFDTWLGTLDGEDEKYGITKLLETAKSALQDAREAIEVTDG